MADTNIYERELLMRIAEGDEKAFSDFFRKYITSMAAIARKILPDNDAYQDILQEVFTKVWLHRDELSEIHSIPAWLKKITLNESLLQLRKKTAYDKRVAALTAHPDPVNNSIEHADYNELKKRLLQFIQTLPQNQKRIYELNRNEGLSPKEIAEKTGLSYGYVRNTLSAVTKSIREHFTGPLGLLFCLSSYFL